MCFVFTDDGAEIHFIIAFPIDRMTVHGTGGGGQVKVIKSVARIYGGGTASRVRVRVHGHLSAGGGGKWPAKPSLVADLTWPSSAGGGGRWKDLDVTHLLRPRKRHSNGDACMLELSVRYPAAVAGTFAIGGGSPVDGTPVPVLHVFLEGVTNGTTACPGEAKRKKRDGGGGKRRRPTSSGLVRRTDCKAETRSLPVTGNNGTEHSSGGGGTNKCCREQMRVVFAEIPGFDFIIEPKWFDAGLCRGRCPAKYNPATRHAFIQSLLWKKHNNSNRGGDNRERAQGRSRRKVRHGGDSSGAKTLQPPPKPCCAPSKLDQLQILHVNEMNPSLLKMTTWKEMAVVECACS